MLGFANEDNAEHSSVWYTDQWAGRIDASSAYELEWSQERCSSAPGRRMGSASLFVAGGVLVHGGEDGGQDTGKYAPGSLLDETLFLRHTPSCSWQSLLPSASSVPAPRVAYHACTAIGETSLACYGGMTVGEGRLQDSSELYIGTVHASSGSITWLVVRAGSEDAPWPSPLHGHALQYLARPAVRIEGGGKATVGVENGLYLYGGESAPWPDSQACPGLLTASPSARTCTLGEVWQYTWSEGEEAGQGRWRRAEPTVLDGQDPPPPRAYSSTALVSGLSQELADMPSPAILLYGGAQCTPSCTTLGDTWLLVPDPIVLLGQGGAPIPGGVGGLQWQPMVHSSTGEDAGVLAGVAEGGQARQKDALWKAQVHAQWAWVLAAARQVSGTLRKGALTWQEPSARHKHVLTSPPHAWQVAAWAQGAVGAVMQGVLSAQHAVLVAQGDWSAVADMHLNALWSGYQSGTRDVGQASQWTSLPLTALLHGGESYMPSTYYGDTWVWTHGQVLSMYVQGMRVASKSGRRRTGSDIRSSLGTERVAGMSMWALGGILCLALCRHWRTKGRVAQSRSRARKPLAFFRPWRSKTGV